MEEQIADEPGGNLFENVSEADTVYLLMKSQIPVSRTSRVKWLLDRLNTIVKQDENIDSWDDPEQEFKVLSVLSDTYSGSSIGRLIPTTKVNLLAGSYRIVFCLDMSPSQCAVDLNHGEILFDELLISFEHSIRGISQNLIVPGCFGRSLTPDIFVTVIAHTPFFMSPAQQVLVKGVRISGVGNSVEELLSSVSSQLKHLSQRIADVAGMAHDHLEQQATDGEQLVGGLFEEETQSELSPNIPMVSPDANFVNMLRYSMLALSLLPEYSLSNIIIITDGVVALPDVNIMETLLMQLHYDSTAVSFIKVGSSFHPHVSAGYVPYEDVLTFLARSTMGTCLESDQLADYQSQKLNLFHRSYLTWTFHNKHNDTTSTSTASQWNGINHYFLGDRAPSLLRKKQTEDKINTSLLHILSRRMREGYTIDKIEYEKDALRLELSLPWKNFIYLQYTLSAPWPSQQSVVHFQVNIAAPYEFLHDITCLIKKELKSTYRQAVVERFWYVLTTLGQSDASTAQHLYSFQTSNNWCMLPESVKNGMPVFVMMNSNVAGDNFKPQFTAGDTACPKFGGAWQPICQLDNSQWSKWFHTHKISVIVRHDDPRPRNLHLTNSSGRFQMVQCRQAAAVLYGRLADWATFVLIENHSYVKFLQWSGSDRPMYFCIIRVTSKLPCAVIHIGFNNGTPGNLRQQVCSELRKELSQLLYVSSPLKCNENACCTILHKPLEKMLIRYERMPSDFSTVVFPDGTQPPNPNSSHMSNAPLVVGALFTTLSRYLYHKRWVWNATHPTNPKLGVNALARILTTLTKMRLKEGFTFAHSSSGIINMVLEVEMAPPGDNRSLSCIVQYVLFPPHSTIRETRPSATANSDSSDMDTDYDIEPAELEMVTEIWIEPQCGQVVNSPPSRAYMNSEPYYKLADKIGYVDSKCVNSLLTLEHLSLMCQTKSVKFEESRMNETYSENLIILNHLPKRRKISNTKKMRPSFSSGLSHKRENGYFGKELSLQNIAQTYSAPPMEERIHHIPFHFNLNNILPISQQAELLFSMFMEEN